MATQAAKPDRPLPSPAAGQPAAGQPAPGQPGPGQLAAGQPAIPGVLVEQQINRTRRQLKMLDLLTLGLAGVTGLVAALLTLAVIDHWVYPIDGSGRWLAFAGLAAAAGWFLVRRVVPALLGSINPVYAARAIEQNEPKLQNSLINLLLLRREQARVPGAVFRAVEHQAARGLQGLGPETVVDRSQLIWIGYVLVAIVGLAAAYRMLSPKNPFQTAARVLTPWADLAPPTRVQILEVLPGDTQGFLGRSLEISATFRGLNEREQARVLVSTTDGAVVEQPYELLIQEGGHHHVATIDALTRDFHYVVVAGDARSRPYQVRVTAEPTVTVERLRYTYPAYTGRAPRTVTDQADVSGLEGTRVEVIARGSHPDLPAYLELNPGQSAHGAPAKSIPMRAYAQESVGSVGPAGPARSGDGGEVPASVELRGEFVLQLKADRATPLFSQYQIRYGKSQPIVHQIAVQRDLAPVVQVLTPNARRTQLPVNQSLKFEVRGVDPDYGLTSLGLRGVSGEQRVLDEQRQYTGRRGQVVEWFVVEPQQLGLQVGDQLRVHAFAADNRHEGSSPAPNLEVTEAYLVEIVAPLDRKPNEPGSGDAEKGPRDAAPPKPDSGAAKSPDAAAGQQPEQQPKQQPDQQSQEGEQGQQGGGGSGQGGEESAQAGKDPGEAEEKGTSDAKQPGGESEPQGGAGGSGEQPSQQPQSGEAGKEPSPAGQQPGGAKPPGEAGQTGKQPPGSSGQQGAGQDGGAGQRGQQGQPPEAGQEQSGRGNGGGRGPTSGDPQAAQGEAQQTGPQGPGGGQAGADQQPLHDGEVFERIQQRLDSQGDTRPSDQPPSQEEGQSATAAGPRDGGSSTDQQPTDPTAPQQAAGNDPDPGAGTSRPADPSQQQPGAQQPGAQQPGAQQPGQRAAGGESGEPQSPGTPADSKDAQRLEEGGVNQRAGEDRDRGAGPPSGNPGASGRGDAQRAEQSRETKEASGDPNTKPGSGNNGQSGAGDATDQNQGQGRGNERAADRPKQMRPESDRPGNDSEPSAVNEKSKHQSDSRGKQGDRAGGGGRGQGQSGQQQGNDSAGSQSSADEGAGASSESGAGETAQRGGDREPSDGPTGAPGEAPGAGSGARENPRGSQPGDAPQSAGKPSRPTNAPEGNGRGSQRDGGTGEVTGGGVPGRRGSGETAETLPEVAGDRANLEYARKATDLVLDYLDSQKHNPDPELLEELNWSPEDLKQFLARWKNLKQGVQQGARGQRELDESLRSLGLSPQKASGRSGTTAADSVRGLREGGGAGEPPAGYLDLFNAFKKGTARSGNRD